MAVNFPDSPTTGQIFRASPGVSFVYQGGAWTRAPMTTALPKNYIINPGMLVNLQNVGASTAGVIGNYYAAEQWRCFWSVTGGSLYANRWDGQNPHTGSKTCYIHVTTPVASLAASDYVMIGQVIEGIRVADLQWGTANAKDIVLTFYTAYNFGAGTYSIRIANGAYDRSYVASFIIPGGWARPIIRIPGDTTGTWLKDVGTAGMRVEIVQAVGSIYHGVEGWQAGDKYAVAGQTNPISAVTDLHVAAVGLYADPYKTGMPPSFELPDLSNEIKRCQRYWYKGFGFVGGASAATAGSRIGMRHPVPMAKKPVGTIRGLPRMYDGGVTGPVSTLNTNTSNFMHAEFDVTSTASTFTPGRALTMYYQTENDYIEMDARLIP